MMLLIVSATCILFTFIFIHLRFIQYLWMNGQYSDMEKNRQDFMSLKWEDLYSSTSDCLCIFLVWCAAMNRKQYVFSIVLTQSFPLLLRWLWCNDQERRKCLVLSMSSYSRVSVKMTWTLEWTSAMSSLDWSLTFRWTNRRACSPVHHWSHLRWGVRETEERKLIVNNVQSL